MNMSAPWFEAPERTETTKDLVAGGLMNTIDLHTTDTATDPRSYRFTDKGAALWARANTWKDARHIRLPEGS